MSGRVDAPSSATMPTLGLTGDVMLGRKVD
jgi:hypothetical protein